MYMYSITCMSLKRLQTVTVIHDVHVSVLISSYGAPLAQRAAYLALHSSLFGSDGAVDYDYIRINSLLTGSNCIPKDAHTNHC